MEQADDRERWLRRKDRDKEVGGIGLRLSFLTFTSLKGTGTGGEGLVRLKLSLL